MFEMMKWFNKIIPNKTQDRTGKSPQVEPNSTNRQKWRGKGGGSSASGLNINKTVIFPSSIASLSLPGRWEILISLISL